MVRLIGVGGQWRWATTGALAPTFTADAWREIDKHLAGRAELGVTYRRGWLGNTRALRFAISGDEQILMGFPRRTPAPASRPRLFGRFFEERLLDGYWKKKDLIPALIRSDFSEVAAGDSELARPAPERARRDRTTLAPVFPSKHGPFCPSACGILSARARPARRIQTEVRAVMATALNLNPRRATITNYCSMPINNITKGLPKRVESVLCETGGKVIVARLFEEDGKVYMEKTCPEHGTSICIGPTWTCI